MKRSLREDYDISRLNDEHEGILWLNFKPKIGGESINCCVCYLLPVDSTRSIDCTECLETLMCQIHEYGAELLFYMRGDFNASVSNLEDFIAGIDHIPERNVVDLTSNKHG